jgi:putative acetyltransferase
MKIRKVQRDEIEDVVELWYQTSLKSHSFIDKSHFLKNKDEMITRYLPNSETYVAVDSNHIFGFVTMIHFHLSALYVSNSKQGCGIGSKLLNLVKSQHNSLILNVYKKNEKSVKCYTRQGFQVISENLEERTGEVQFLMGWDR